MTDAELDALQKRLNNPPFGTETSELNAMAAAASAISHLRKERDEARENCGSLHAARNLVIKEYEKAVDLANSYRAGNILARVEGVKAGLEAAAQVAPDSAGREWVKGSLWDVLAREMSAKIAALNPEEIARKP